jgi:zinc-ribbon domain
MFCNSCGALNPDDASFCSGCGKPLVRPRTAAPPPMGRQEPAPLPDATEAPKRDAATITPIVAPASAAEALPAALTRAKKRRGVRWGWVVFACIVLSIFLYPLRSGGGICDTARDQVVQQVPPAVEILAARYPLQIGLLRSMFNDKGMVDSIAQEYVRASIQKNQQEPGRLSCYLSYYVVMLNKDGVRTSIADWMETRLQLK